MGAYSFFKIFFPLLGSLFVLLHFLGSPQVIFAGSFQFVVYLRLRVKASVWCAKWSDSFVVTHLLRSELSKIVIFVGDAGLALLDALLDVV